MNGDGPSNYAKNNRSDLKQSGLGDYVIIVTGTFVIKSDFLGANDLQP